MNTKFRIATGAVALMALASCSTPVGQGMSRDFNAAVSQLSTVSLFSDGYLSDTSDVCFSQRQEMAENGSVFDSEVVQKALLGAAGGGFMALVTGGNVARGAAIGGGLGLAAGFLSKLQEEGLNGTEITQRVRTEVREDNRRIDMLIASFDDLSDCRKREAASIQSAFNAGNIDKDAAQTQMAGVRDRFGEDRRKFKEIADAISEKSRNNAALYNDIAADNGGKALQVREYRKGSRSVRASGRAQKEAGTAEGALVANKAEVNRLQDDCLTNVKKRDDCYEKVAKAEEVEDDIELDLG